MTEEEKQGLVDLFEDLEIRRGGMDDPKYNVWVDYEKAKRVFRQQATETGDWRRYDCQIAFLTSYLGIA